MQEHPRVGLCAPHPTQWEEGEGWEQAPQRLNKEAPEEALKGDPHFPAPSLFSFISMGSQHRGDPDPPSLAKASGLLQQPLPSFVLTLIRNRAAERAARKAAWMWGPALTHTPPWGGQRGKWGCLLCQKRVPPGHPLLHTSSLHPPGTIAPKQGKPQQIPPGCG